MKNQESEQTTGLVIAAKHATGLVLARTLRFVQPVPQRAADAPIKLYWWTDRVNFGDVLSPAIVRHVSGCDVEWAPLKTCEMCSTGSIYGWLRARSGRYMRDVHIWGSGIKKPSEALGTTDYLHHHLVRGPLTAVVVGDDTLPMGDPGLLAGEAFGITQAGDARGIGVIPHRSQWSRTDYIEHLRALPGIRLIDFRTEDCQACIEEIAACEVIFSSSLHGLIVADALEIPNFWMQGHRFAGAAHDFKFFDYGLSVGRDLSRPVGLEAYIEAGQPKSQGDFTYFARIDAVKEAIRTSFPRTLFGRRTA